MKEKIEEVNGDHGTCLAASEPLGHQIPGFEPSIPLNGKPILGLAHLRAPWQHVPLFTHQSHPGGERFIIYCKQTPDPPFFSGSCSACGLLNTNVPRGRVQTYVAVGADTHGRHAGSLLSALLVPFTASSATRLFQGKTTTTKSLSADKRKCVYFLHVWDAWRVENKDPHDSSL